MLIKCQRNTILIGKRDEHGRYQIPLTQDHGKCQSRRPMKEARRKLHQAHSVYDLRSKEESVKWMHAVCGYRVKYTWIKAIKVGNYVEWPMLTERNIARYYPVTKKIPKVHLNQSRKNVKPTEPKRTPLKMPKPAVLQGHNTRDVYIILYELRNTVFSNQTGQFPTHSQLGNKYIMVMVEIDSNVILV